MAARGRAAWELICKVEVEEGVVGRSLVDGRGGGQVVGPRSREGRREERLLSTGWMREGKGGKGESRLVEGEVDQQSSSLLRDEINLALAESHLGFFSNA